jgi:hypothetical protein
MCGFAYVFHHIRDQQLSKSKEGNSKSDRPKDKTGEGVST